MKNVRDMSPGFIFLKFIRLPVVPEPCAASYSISYASVISFGLTNDSNWPIGCPE